MDEEQPPLLDFLLENCEKFFPFCKEKKHYNEGKRVQYICLSKDKECLNYRHAICQDCLEDRWICQGHQYIQIKFYIKYYQDNLESVKTLFNATEFQNNKQNAVIDIQNLINIVKNLKQQMEQIENNLNEILQNLIQIRIDILPKEIDIAKVFQSLTIFQQIWDNEKFHEADPFKTLSKQALKNLNNLNKLFDFLEESLPLKQQKESNQKSRTFRKQDISNQQVQTIEFQYTIAEKKFREIDLDSSKLYLQYRTELEKQDNFWGSFLDETYGQLEQTKKSLQKYQSQHEDIQKQCTWQSRKEKPSSIATLGSQSSQADLVRAASSLKFENPEEFDKELFLVFSDTDTYIEKKFYIDQEDYTWVPSQFLKYNSFLNFGLIKCETINDLKNLKNYGEIERKTLKQNNVIIIRRENEKITIQDLMQELTVFIKNLRRSSFGISLILNLSCYINRSKTLHNFSPLFDSLSLFKNLEFFNIDITSLLFEKVDDVLKRLIEFDTKYLEIILSHHCLNSRVYDTLLLLCQQSKIKQIVLIFKFRTLSNDSKQETIEGLQTIMRLLCLSLQKVKGLNFLFQNPVQKIEFELLYNCITFFTKKNNLKYLNIYSPNSQIGSNEFSLFPKMLFGLENLQELTLNFVSLTLGYGSNLELILSGLQNVQLYLKNLTINFSQTKIGNTGLNQISNHLKLLERSTLQNLSLDLSRNSITEDGMKNFNRVLQQRHFSTLKFFELNLIHNNLGPKGAKFLCDGLSQLQCSLIHLTLNLNNNLILNEGATEVFNVVKSLRKFLTSLKIKLASNKLSGSNIGTILGQVFQQRTTLNVGDEQQILDTYLKTLFIDFSDNDLSQDTLQNIVAGINQNYNNLNFITFNLMGCIIGEKGLKMLYDMNTRKTSQLQLIQLYLDPIVQELSTVALMKTTQLFQIF